MTAKRVANMNIASSFSHDKEDLKFPQIAKARPGGRRGKVTAVKTDDIVK